jgi:hypothetical protein
MALLEDMFKTNMVTGLAVGLAAMVLAPTLLSAMGRVLRPAAKSVIKGGMVVYREMIAEAGELASDLIEEVRSELEEETRAGIGRATAIATAPRAKAEVRSEKH